jgi:hypothetical protein
MMHQPPSLVRLKKGVKRKLPNGTLLMKFSEWKTSLDDFNLKLVM